MPEQEVLPALPEPRGRTELSPQERAVLDAWRAGLLGPRQQLVSTGPSPLAVLFSAISLVLVLGLLALLVLLLGLINTTTGLAGSVGQEAGQVARTVGQTAAGLAQSVADLTDPAHPPREALVYDTEFSELRLIEAGAQVAQTD